MNDDVRERLTDDAALMYDTGINANVFREHPPGHIRYLGDVARDLRALLAHPQGGVEEGFEGRPELPSGDAQDALPATTDQIILASIRELNTLSQQGEDYIWRPASRAVKALLCAEQEMKAGRAIRKALAGALSRQADNMAFVLNRVSLPDQWHAKFEQELAADRVVLPGPPAEPSCALCADRGFSDAECPLCKRPASVAGSGAPASHRADQNPPHPHPESVNAGLVEALAKCRVAPDGPRHFTAYAPNGAIVDECLSSEEAAWNVCRRYVGLDAIAKAQAHTEPGKAGEWVTVPREPTEAMTKAAKPWFTNWGYMRSADKANAIENGYRAMFNASPPPPVGETL